MRRRIIVLGLCSLMVLEPAAVFAKCTDSLVASPNPGAYSAGFFGIGGTGPSDIWAVGDSQPSGFNTRSLIEHWNGSFWSIVPSPTVPGSVTDALFGVSADSPTDAWAIGEWGPKRSSCCSRPFLDHWDGTSWTAIKGLFNTTEGLTNISSAPRDPASIWVVGFSGYIWNCRLPHGCPTSPLAERWNGSAWLVTKVPYPTGSASLAGVLSLPGGSAWAVGFDSEAAHHNIDVPLILHHFQNRWISVQGAVSHGVLTSVSGSSDSDIWAVGYHGYGRHDSFVEHWNGSVWTEVGLPLPESTYIESISVGSPTDAWISGYHNPKTGGNFPYLAHWDGTAWSWNLASPIGSESGSDNSVFDTTGGAWTAGSALLYPPSPVPETFTTFAHC